MSQDTTNNTYRVDFLNPEFRPGELNVTIRNGSKWADRLACGDVVLLGETDKQDNECTGMIVGIRELDLMNDKDRNNLLAFIDFEHDSSCRSFDGLSAAMDAAYPDGWGPVITAIFFVPME